jgi:hypothetical protein
VRERHLRAEAHVGQHGERALAVLAPEEHVQVLGVPDDPGVRRQSMRTADQELDARSVQRLEGQHVHAAGLEVEDRVELGCPAHGGARSGRQEIDCVHGSIPVHAPCLSAGPSLVCGP